ncbi:hypothetical protein NC653_037604 [Populus alba x Populus x berolinensis]|uniref:Uncharacterized protein n=1 Tax=Populus alba x Populus x berolinensis TaxID=444605 RepID=A0AAD6LGD3_9ROSI|nr:hypothetical protein NC653_037604 [Populus alba x Populus x berolinensis]
MNTGLDKVASIGSVFQGIPSYVHLMHAKHLPTFYNVCKKGFQEAQDRVRRAQNTEVMLVSKLLHRNQ